MLYPIELGVRVSCVPEVYRISGGLQVRLGRLMAGCGKKGRTGDGQRVAGNGREGRKKGGRTGGDGKEGRRRGEQT
jgi:hypothetical protein